MKKISKLLSVILCLAMMLSFALVASAAETDNALTSMDELVSGEYYIVCSNDVSMGAVDGTWITVGESLWTVTVTDNGVTLCDANGVYIAPKGGNSNGLSTKEYEWAVSCTDGLFTFAGQGDDTVYLAFNSSEQYYKFRGYKVSTCTGDLAAEYPSAFYLVPASGEDEVVPPAGPVDCEIPGTLTYTFASDDAASAGVAFRWVATADGELGVARMGETFMTNVLINGTYGEIGDYGYIVKTGNTVEIIVYGYGAGTVNVPVEFVTGSEGDDVVGTESNPEVITANTEYVKTLESGEYFYQFTATVAGEVTINTAGDGTHNMEVFVNGDATKIYSNWDNDGAFVKLNVAEGDVLTVKVYFDFPGAGTITFTVVAETADVEPEPEPTPDPKAPVANGDIVMIYFPNGDSYISANANDTGKKLLEATKDEAALWTVVVDENGYYTFIYDGKYLTSGETGNSLTLADAASDYSLWTLEEAENGWFVKNVNAAYNGSAQYLEYYSGFTTYGKKDTSDVNLYTFQFVIVESAVEPNPNPGTGDAIFAVLSILAVSGMGITAVASKKN